MSITGPSAGPSNSPGTYGGEDEGAPIFAEINITPLTDIFLVLLIIFMVTSSVMSQMGVDVKLPKASAAASESKPEGVVVTLTQGGEMMVNGVKMPRGDLAQFETALRVAFEKTPSRLVVLEGDREAYLGSAIEIMDRARKAGADKFAIATEPK